MTRERYAEELVNKEGRPRALKSLKESLERWKSKKESNVFRFLNDTLEIIKAQ